MRLVIFKFTPCIKGGSVVELDDMFSLARHSTTVSMVDAFNFVIFHNSRKFGFACWSQQEQVRSYSSSNNKNKSKVYDRKKEEATYGLLSLVQFNF